MISKEEVQHIADLARLEVTDKELKKIQQELGSILEYVALLEEVDVSHVEPTLHSVPLENVMREDKPEPEAQDTVSEILKQASEKEGNYVKVKGIL